VDAKQIWSKYHREIGTAIVAFFIMLGPVLMLAMSTTIAMEGVIVDIDENGDIWARVKIEGVRFDQDNIVGWNIRVVAKCISFAGSVREPIYNWGPFYE